MLRCDRRDVAFQVDRQAVEAQRREQWARGVCETEVF
jgi:hypothetical protein